MSYTPVQNRFWSDGWVRQLNALDRYLFLYLLTNGRAKQVGIYELPLDLMGAESGIDEKDLRLSMLQRLEPKVYYRDGWVIFRNYPMHRVSDSPQVIKGLLNEFSELPKHVQEIARSLGYPIDTLSIPINTRLDYTKLNKTKPVANARGLSIEKDIDPDKPTRISGSKKVTPEMREVFELFDDNPARKAWHLREIERTSASILFSDFGIEELRKRYGAVKAHRGEEMCPVISSPSQLLEKMPSMENFMKNL